jgi:hypothetical protein
LEAPKRQPTKKAVAAKLVKEPGRDRPTADPPGVGVVVDGGSAADALEAVQESQCEGNERGFGVAHDDSVDSLA